MMTIEGATSAAALLLVQADVDEQHELEWNRWYSGKHVPDLQRMPGFLTGRRFERARDDFGVGLNGPLPKYLAIYDLKSADALRSPEYTAPDRPTNQQEDRAMIRLFRNTNRAEFELIGEWSGPEGEDPLKADGLLAVGLVPEPGYEEEYNAWYDEEHIPYLRRVPGVLRARRFRALQGEPQYLALYELASPEVRFSEEFGRAADTPWSARMRAHCARRLTGLFRAI